MIRFALSAQRVAGCVLGAVGASLAVLTFAACAGRTSATNPLTISLSTDARTLASPDTFTLVVQNLSPWPLAIIGASGNCDLQRCVDVQGLPLTVPALGQKTFCVRERSRDAIEASTELRLYTNFSGQPVLATSIRNGFQADRPRARGDSR
jgi:hypothetical protein